LVFLKKQNENPRPPPTRVDLTLEGEAIPATVQVSKPSRRAIIICAVTNGTNENTNKRKTNMSNYNKLYTPADSTVVFIDYQPQITFGVANVDL